MDQINDIEAESLPAHVSICQQRYHHLNLRIDQIEKQVEKIEKLVIDIHSKIADLAERQNQRWDKTQVALIASLVGVVGFLFSRFLH